MIKDTVGQEIRPGLKAVWSSYNHLYMGTVKRVTKHRVIMQAVSQQGICSYRHMPFPHKVMIVSELPKQTLFWALTG
jgi:hypothetical protein